MLNVISVDVEEYFHAANLQPVADPSRWRSLPSRVEPSTRAVLDLFERSNVRATFFILGYCARRYPQLVKDIASAGHEIASHGYGHRIAYQQTPRQFLRDVRIAKQLLEDLTGEEVLGYRAPNFSITSRNQWAYDALIEAGYRYDSSRYPVWHPRYANTAQSVEPELIKRENGSIACFPLAVAPLRLLGREIRLPVAGGAYWRLLPRWFNMFGLRRIEAEGRWFTSYFHPWEIDGEQPYFKQLPFRTRLRHYGAVSRFESIVEYYLKRFDFAPLKEVGADLIKRVDLQ